MNRVSYLVVALVLALGLGAACSGDDDDAIVDDNQALGEPELPDNPCTLLRGTDIERLTGLPEGAGAAGEDGSGLDTGCTWSVEASAPGRVALDVTVGDPTAFDEAQASPGAAAVEGAGDQAFVQAGRSTGGTREHTLYAYRGDYYLTLATTGVLGADDATTALRDTANSVFEQLGR